ncbi:hypothetical protein KPH14_012983, partial [Odynerus spinipes]
MSQKKRPLNSSSEGEPSPKTPGNSHQETIKQLYELIKELRDEINSLKKKNEALEAKDKEYNQQKEETIPLESSPTAASNIQNEEGWSEVISKRNRNGKQKPPTAKKPTTFESRRTDSDGSTYAPEQRKQPPRPPPIIIHGQSTK